MRIRRKPWARPELAVCPFFVDDPASKKGNWKSVFKKQQPICLELGCGKGSFAAEIALRNPDINFLAVDIKHDMLGVARRNIVRLFEEKQREVDNLVITAFNVEHIEEMLGEDDKVDKIYINFCNPWPRSKHNKRRLTYPPKLQKYKSFLKKGGEIRFKTDDLPLFNDTLEYFQQTGYNILYQTNDLHNSDVTDNILTEHEIMFSSEGIKINYCVAVYYGNNADEY
ncbi:MAG: tRNA (guanosine(46)-N7)-methyltransferase TrmB [Clostridia bacterium]|nr:tRNA (guanosine(46)-N7)-methyltransferase TrmB [Clostridia bacterium]